MRFLSAEGESLFKPYNFRMEEIEGFRYRAKVISDVDLEEYRQVSNIRHTLVGNKIADHSDVVGASPVGAAPTTSSFST